MINYMDKYNTPEEYITFRVASKLQQVIQKDDLIKLAKESGCEFNEKHITKKELVVLTAEKVSYQKLAEMVGVGVSSVSFQKKFGITPDEVKRMARLGFIKVTGKEKFRLYGKYRYADTYSPYDYFRLTADEVQQWLSENPKGTRKKKSSL